MRKNFGAKPWTYPQPVFIVATYDGEGNPDAMNAAWGGIDYDDQINLCLSAGHKTVKNLVECELVSYDPEMCHLVGRIVNVSADERILDEKGKIDPAKLRPISFDPVHNAYLEVGGHVGSAFKDGIALKK